MWMKKECISKPEQREGSTQNSGFKQLRLIHDFPKQANLVGSFICIKLMFNCLRSKNLPIHPM